MKRTFVSKENQKIQDATLSQGEPHDASVNFNTYQILRRHRAVSVPLHEFLVSFNISDHSSAEIAHSSLIFW